MRPLRPLFNRSASRDELERQAERLRNRDWVELLQVIHPAQAEKAQREYLLARLRDDWKELVSPLLAQHSQPNDFRSGTLLVLCDHNTFANEIALLAPVLAKKIEARYGHKMSIRAQATKKSIW